MAFCKYCGKQLNEGQVCDCPGSVAAGAAQPVTPAPAPAPAPVPTPAPAPAPTPVPTPAQGTTQQTTGQQASGQTTINITLPDKEKVTATAKNAWGSIIGILKKPATEGAAFVARADLTLSICLIVIQAVCSALFGAFFVGKINGLIRWAGEIKFSGIKAFFLTLLFSVIFSAILMLLFWLAGLITKMKTNWKQMLALVAVRSVVLVPFILVSALLMLISIFTGMLVGFPVFYGANLLGMLALVSAIRGVEGCSDNKAVYVVFVVSVIFMMVSIWLGLKEAPAYLPSSIREGMDGLRMLDSLMNNIF